MILMVALVTLLLPPITQAQNTNLIATWQGELNPGVKLRIVFKVRREADGTLAGTMDSPDQGAKDIPVAEIRYDESKLVLDAKTIAGIFEGELKDSELLGAWRQ